MPTPLCPLRPPCPADQLCRACYSRELVERRGQARVVGEVWAEEVGRRPEHRGRDSWPDDVRAIAIAERKVEQLAADPRLRAELAKLCVAGAAAWWERRPAGYRS